MHGISLPPIKVPEQMEIRLTDTEDQMCSLLDECSQWMKDEKSKSTSCRIAGGWVRDKVSNLST
jgi:tRNA nucleotidyltransferase (CCA-adding enzyme)